MWQSDVTNPAPRRYSSKKKGQGAQIDLLFDGKDNCINLCEIKFSLSEVIIDKNYAAVLKQKKAVFRERTRARKTIFLTLITMYGAKKDNYINLIQGENYGGFI